jgi:Flp pilus assembly CpaF family ATPase
MRPATRRIVVGEVRSTEALDPLLALNPGLRGMATLHANSAREALVKLCTLPMLAGQSREEGIAQVLGRRSAARVRVGSSPVSSPRSPKFLQLFANGKGVRLSAAAAAAE